jgi:hypothetical protein
MLIGVGPIAKPFKKIEPETIRGLIFRRFVTVICVGRRATSRSDDRRAEGAATAH